MDIEQYGQITSMIEAGVSPAGILAFTDPATIGPATENAEQVYKKAQAAYEQTQIADLEDTLSGWNTPERSRNAQAELNEIAYVRAKGTLAVKHEFERLGKTFLVTATFLGAAIGTALGLWGATSAAEPSIAANARAHVSAEQHASYTRGEDLAIGAVTIIGGLGGMATGVWAGFAGRPYIVRFRARRLYEHEQSERYGNKLPS